MEMEGVNVSGNLNDSTEGLRTNLEQLQLNELQKISSQLQFQRVSNPAIVGGLNPMQQTNFAGVTINGQPAGAIVNNQPMSAPYAYNSQSATAPLNYGPNILGQVLGMSEMMFAAATTNLSKDRISSPLKEMRESNQTFFQKMYDRIADNPLVKYASIDYSRTSAKDVEAINEQAGFAVQRAGLDIASAGASIGGGMLGGKIGAAGGAAIGTAIAPGIGTAIGGLVGSIAGYSGGSAIGSGAVGLIKGEVQDRQDYTTWLQQNGSKIINSLETNNGEVNSGFTGTERKQLGKWLANINTEFNMSDDEINTILQGVTDAGLMKSATDMESFQKKFKSLVGTVKEGAKMLNTSYEEMTQMLGDLSKEGIKSDAQRALTLDQLKAVSDLTGMDALKVYNNSEQLKSMLFAGTSADPTTSLQTSTGITALGSAFMDMGGAQANGPNKEAFDKLYGSLYYGGLNNGWTGENFGTNMTALSGKLYDYGTTTGQLSMPMLMYAAKYENGMITGFDAQRLAEMQSYLDNGDLNGATRKAQEWANANKTDAGNISTQLTQMSGAQIYGLMANTAGVSQTGSFQNSFLKAASATSGMINEKDVGTVAGAGQYLSQVGDMSAQEGQMIFEWNQAASGNIGQAVSQEIDTNTDRNQIRRNSSKNQHVGFLQGVQNKWENIKQGFTTAVTEGLQKLSITDSVMDFFSGDTAMREGYGSAAYSLDSYTDIYNSLSDSSSLFKKAGIDTSNLNTSDHTGDKLNTTWIWGNMELRKMVDKKSDRTKTLKKKIEKSNLSDEEKQEMLSQIETSEGQTQSAVAGYLEMVQDIGGDKYRSKLIKHIDTTSYGAGIKLDDLADSKQIEKLTLNQQRQIQDQLPKVIANQLAKDFKNDDLVKQFKEIFEGSDALRNSEVYAKAIKDNKLSTQEIETLMGEMQKVAYSTVGSGGDVNDAFLKDMEGYLGENGEQLGKINDSLKSNNDYTDKTLKLIEENNEKQDKVNKELEKYGKKLDQQITSLKK